MLFLLPPIMATTGAETSSSKPVLFDLIFRPDACAITGCVACLLVDVTEMRGVPSDIVDAVAADIMV